MGYALFAQRKLVLTGQINMIQLQQTQRSDEQMQLATESANLKQRLSALNEANAYKMKGLYDKLSASETDGSTNSDQADFNTQNGQQPETTSKDDVELEIKKLENELKIETEQINRETYQISLKENRLQMEVKSLDTKLTALQQQLEAVEQAEGKGIEGATPKFGGLG